MDDGILIGYFAQHAEARKALRELRRHGFSRTALVHKGLDEDVSSTEPFVRRRLLIYIFVAIMSGAFGRMAFMLLQLSELLPVRFNSMSLAITLSCAVIGTLIAFLCLRRSRHAVDPACIRDYARWLVSGESVLIVQAPVESLLQPMSLLRESSDPPPACPAWTGSISSSPPCRPGSVRSSRSTSPALNGRRPASASRWAPAPRSPC